MGKLPNIVPISDLRQDAAKVLKQVRESQEPLIITQRGRAAAVMLSVESFERSERDNELWRSPVLPWLIIAKVRLLAISSFKEFVISQV